MKFCLEKSIEILSRTPNVLIALLQDVSDEWTLQNEGENTWSPFDVVGHLIHGELTDWIPRMELILSDKTNKTFEPFDRFAQYEISKGKTLNQLLVEFKELRNKNLEILRSKNLNQIDLQKTGIHPALGESKLVELLSTWTVHDLGHIAQITRVMAKQYKSEVGAWSEYLGILK